MALIIFTRKYLYNKNYLPEYADVKMLEKGVEASPFLLINFSKFEINKIYTGAL